MINNIKAIIRWLLIVNRDAVKCLTFTFFESKEKTELKFVGLSKLHTKREIFCQRNGFIGFIRPWGHNIPVIDLKSLYKNRKNITKGTSCIIIFDHFEDCKYHFAMVVEDITNVINFSEITEGQMMPILLSAKRHLLDNSGTAHKNTLLRDTFTVNLN